MKKVPRKVLYDEIKRLRAALEKVDPSLVPEPPPSIASALATVRKLTIPEAALDAVEDLPPDPWEEMLLDAIEHIHTDLVAIRAHLGIPNAGCAGPTPSE